MKGQSNLQWKPALIMTLLLIGFRCLGVYAWPETPNFQPIGAFVFCCVAVLGWRYCWVPLLAWLISYPITTWLIYYGSDHAYGFFNWNFSIVLASLLIILLLGSRFQQNNKFLPLLLGSLAGAVIFYLITNTYAWLTSPLYTKNFTGFTQALWWGSVGSPLPTWAFFRNSLVANIIFSACFFVPYLKFYRKPLPLRVTTQATDISKWH